MLAHLAQAPPDPVPTWVEVVGHLLHYGVLGAGLLGVLLLVLPARRPGGWADRRGNGPAGRSAR